MTRGVRQGCSASGFLFAIAFDPIFRWLQDAIIPRNPPGLDFLQHVPCAYGDDFTVAASSFRRLRTALTPAFKVVDQTAGLNLNHRKCCWVQYGSESCQSLVDWLATNCEEFREMKLVKHAKYVGTMIGLEGRIHCWTAPRKKIIQRAQKINVSTKSLVEILCDLKIYVFFGIGLYWIHIRTRRSNPRARVTMHYCRPVQCHSHQLIMRWLRVWPWTRHAWDPCCENHRVL